MVSKGRMVGSKKVNRGAWTVEEDEKLSRYINAHGETRWRLVPVQAGLNRCGRSCRLRWLNYLRPNIKRGNISDQEEDLIIRLHKLLGNRWSLIAGRLPGRTDNEIKNYWNTHLSKKLKLLQQQPDDKERPNGDSPEKPASTDRVSNKKQKQSNGEANARKSRECDDLVISELNLDQFLSGPEGKLICPSFNPNIEKDAVHDRNIFEQYSGFDMANMHSLSLLEKHGDDSHFGLEWLKHMWNCNGDWGSISDALQ